MKENLSIQLKAAFLLLVFSLNTMIGFACAIGIDMGFNTAHHHEEDAVITHAGTYHHTKADNDPHTSKDGKDNCCNDKVIKFAQVDKSLPQSLNTGINAVFFTAFVSSFYNIDVLQDANVIPSLKYFVQGYHPPIPDIRLEIQSFQI